MIATSPTPPASDAPVASTAGKKVLIVDDTEEIRIIISESLNLFGFVTLTAGDGTGGVGMARKHNPGLIICDINMPNKDGYATLTALREAESTATIPLDRQGTRLNSRHLGNSYAVLSLVK